MESDGSWNGIVGMILKGQIEIGLNSFYVSAARQTVTGIGHPFYTERLISIAYMKSIYGKKNFKAFANRCLKRGVTIFKEGK